MALDEKHRTGPPNKIDAFKLGQARNAATEAKVGGLRVLWRPTAEDQRNWIRLMVRLTELLTDDTFLAGAQPSAPLNTLVVVVERYRGVSRSTFWRDCESFI